MFDYTDCPEGPILPGQHSIERWLIEEQLRHILMSNHLERKESFDIFAKRIGLQINIFDVTSS